MAILPRTWGGSASIPGALNAGTASGFGDYVDLLAGYEAAGGVPIELGRVRAWQALGSLKWGVMCLMMYQSWAGGTEASVERPMIGRRVSETEIDLIEILEEGL